MRGSALARLRKASMGSGSSQSRTRRALGLKNNSSINDSTKAEAGFVGNSQGDMRKYAAYRDVDKLTFVAAAKILFTKSSEKKIFGFDYHFVRLFFACVMPALAVCLIPHYVRYAVTGTEEEVEKKQTQAEEEEKAAESDPELRVVEMRLEKLEENMKEIVVVSDEESSSSRHKQA